MCTCSTTPIPAGCTSRTSSCSDPCSAVTSSIGYTASSLTMPDIGGRVPGGNAVDSTEIFQEGLQLPPLKLYAADACRRAAGRVASQRADARHRRKAISRRRSPPATSGSGGCESWSSVTVRRFPESVRADPRLHRVACSCRALRIPDGDYPFEDHIDDDGFDSGPIPIRVKLTVAGDSYPPTSPEHPTKSGRR